MPCAFAASGTVWVVMAPAGRSSSLPLADCLRRRVRFLLQPLKSTVLTESGIPAWAEEFIRKVPLAQILDLIEAADVMRVKMYVCSSGAIPTRACGSLVGLVFTLVLRPWVDGCGCLAGVSHTAGGKRG